VCDVAFCRIFFFAQRTRTRMAQFERLRRPITYISTQSCLFESRGPSAQI
jgi:hypothetical protein